MSARALAGERRRWMISIGINNGRMVVRPWASHYGACSALERIGLIRIAADGRAWLTDAGRVWVRDYDNGDA